MKKSLYVFVVGSLLFFAGCGEDDPAPSQCLPVKITNLLELDGTGSLEFSYTDQKLNSITITTEEDGDVEVFTLTASYTGDRITRLAAPLNIVVLDISYDANNRVSEVTQSFLGDEFSQTFTYNGSGQLVRTDYFYDNGSGTIVSDRYDTFNYPNTTTRNASSRSEFRNSGSGFTLYLTYNYEYDDKNSFTKEIPVIAYLLDNLYGESNQTKITEIYTGDDPYITNITYQYNDRGYPTSFTISATGDAPVTGTVDYNCQ